ncbi:MAG TPA: hypothetical protein VFZ34_20610, partial [Blastocatellia bacterium]|nr:hypothetical protein [Blastocatellia bacterium]
ANYASVFNLAAGAPAFTAFYGLDKLPKDPTARPLTAQPTSGRFFLPDGVFTRALPDKQRLPTVDAYNFTVQYQLTEKMSVEAAYVGNKGTHVFAGDGPAIDANQARLDGFGTIPRNQRRPLFNKFGWTQGIDYFCNCADNRYDSLQVKLDKRFANGYSILTHYTLQRALQDGGEYFFFDANLNRGPADWDRTHNFVFSQVYDLPIGKGRKFLSDLPMAADLLLGGWQINSNTTIQSGLPYNLGYDAGANIDTGPNRPNVSGDLNAELSGTRYTYNLSAVSNPGRGKFGNLKRNALRGPGYWRTDASLFKKFRFTETRELEFRVESVNFFNHVNLGNPDSFVGSFNAAGALVPNSNLGRINSTAYFGADPMRNFQFALRFKF